MKKSFKYSTILALALFLNTSVSFGASMPEGYVDPISPDKVVVAQPVGNHSKVSPEPTNETKEVPLTDRKIKAETDLKNLHGQLTIFTTRTQLAIDRLAVKDIDVLKAQNELTLSVASLLEAKTNLDKFSAIEITNEASEKEVTELRNLLLEIEENLKNARITLINSLTELKVAVSLSINAQ